MKKNKILFVFILLLATATVAFSSTFIYVKLNENVNSGSDVTGKNALVIVTSCNPMYMAALNVCDGVEGVEVYNLSQPTTGCLHDYTLTTGDMKMLSKADLFVINGAGMEGFLSDVMIACPDLKIVEASKGLELLGEEGNSHCWMSPKFYAQEIENIALGLSELDANHAEAYNANSKAYVEKMTSELEKYEAQVLLSSANHNVFLFHEAFEYVAEDLAREIIDVMDLDEERQVSAGELQGIIEEAKSCDVGMILAEEEYGAQVAELVSESAGTKVVYLNPMIRGSYNKDSYIEIMKENYQKIIDCL